MLLAVMLTPVRRAAEHTAIGAIVTTHIHTQVMLPDILTAMVLAGSINTGGILVTDRLTSNGRLRLVLHSQQNTDLLV